MIRNAFEYRHPTLVCFSGIDGAGKSTQIEALRARLSEIGARVSLVTFWEDVARLTRMREMTSHGLFKGDKGVGTPTTPVHRRDKNVRSWFMTAVRFALYFVDAISLRIVTAKTLNADADVVIFDRYLYDELANLSLQNPIVHAYVRLLLMLVPQPNICFLLDADPVQAYARKPEYPLNFLHSSRASYLALAELVGGMTIIAPQPVEEVERQVLRQVLTNLSAAGVPRLPSLAHGAPRASE